MVCYVNYSVLGDGSVLTDLNCVDNGVMCSQCISIYLVIFKNRNNYSLSCSYV